MADQNHDIETQAGTVTETGHDAGVHGYDHWYQDSSVWVALAIITFFLLLIWKKIPAMIGRMLDNKVSEIATQLDNARSLREEASALLAKYQRDQRGAEKMAADMIAKAEAEVKILTAEANSQIKEITGRRIKLAEQKIAQAEANALKEIRQLVVQVATTAARELIADNMKLKDQNALTKSSIDKLDRQLH